MPVPAGLHVVLLASGLLASLAGCAGPFKSRIQYADRIAGEAGWQRHDIPAGKFMLTGFSTGLEADASDLVVYIEGDGLAWRARRALSRDPSPRDPQGLKLALRDPASKILYLARPCQYVREPDPGCDPMYWSSHRYGETVIAAVDQAIDRIKVRSGASTVALVGVSGGGTVAALLAARRDDVAALTTVAANLDHAHWTRHHGVTPLDGSLNPKDFASRLQSVPQIHFAGAEDDIVPPAVIAAYVDSLPDCASARVVVMPGFDHDCCWVDAWPGLAAR